MYCVVGALGIVFGVLLHFVVELSVEFRKRRPLHYWILVILMMAWFGVNGVFVLDILDIGL